MRIELISVWDYRFVVKQEEAISAMNIVHTNVMRIPLHSEKESQFIKGENKPDYLLRS